MDLLDDDDDRLYATSPLYELCMKKVLLYIVCMSLRYLVHYVACRWVMICKVDSSDHLLSPILYGKLFGSWSPGNLLTGAVADLQLVIKAELNSKWKVIILNTDFKRLISKSFPFGRLTSQAFKTICLFSTKLNLLKSTFFVVLLCFCFVVPFFIFSLFYFLPHNVPENGLKMIQYIAWR